jgi:ferredoxin
MAGEVRIAADRDVCIGAGMCVLVAPKLFDQDVDEGLVVVLSDPVAAEDLSAAEEAVSSCPSGALSLVHEGA